MLPSPRSRRSRHRFAQGQVSPALCPCEPGRPRGVKQAVPYSTHSASRFESRSFRSLCPEYNSRLDVYFPAKTALTPPGRARLSCKQKKQWHTQTISLVLGPAQASAARDGRIHPLCGEIRGRAPQRVSGTARSTLISTLTRSNYGQQLLQRQRQRLLLQRYKLVIPILLLWRGRCLLRLHLEQHKAMLQQLASFECF